VGSAIDLGLSGLGLSHAMFLGKTLNSHSVSHYQGVQMGTGKFNAGVI